MSNFFRRAGWLGLAVLGLAASLGLQVILGAVAGILSMVLVMVSSGGDVSEAVMNEAVMNGAIWGVLAYHLLSLPVFGLWYYFGCGRPRAASPGKVLKPRVLLSILAAGFGLCILANGMVLLEEFVMPAQFQVYLELVEQAGFGTNFLTIIASVALAPIGEELLCRGIILHYGQRAFAGIGTGQTSFWIANVIQALLFGIMHANVVQGSYAFILGLGLGYLRHRYNSLYPSMLTHFLINFLSTFVLGYLLAGVPETLFGAALLLLLGAGITVISVLIGREEKNTKILEQ